jgi:transposase
MSQKRSYKQYPKEFKDEAVALVLEQGYSVADAAKSLGITTKSPMCFLGRRVPSSREK